MTVPDIRGLFVDLSLDGRDVKLSNSILLFKRIKNWGVQEISASPRLAPEIEYWYYSTLQDDGTYAAAEVLEPIDTLPLSALSPPDNEGFLDLNGDEYLNWSVTGSWLQSTLNRGQLATRGASQSVSLEIAVPLSDLEFYKLNYRGEIS